nr:hypothetical protein [Tanacetum cinerariifolium]
METEEISDRYVAPCFINRLEAYDVVKKELIVALRGEIYFVKFIIDPEEDDVEPGVVLGRSFMRLTKGISDFGNGTITIYPELDPFLDSFGETKKTDDDWDLLLDDLNFGDVPEIKGVEIPPFAEPMGILKDVMCQVGVTTIIAKKFILDMPIDRDTPILVGIGFLYTCGSILNTIERITSTFDGIFHQTFLADKISLNTEESDSDDEEDYGIQSNNFRAPLCVAGTDEEIFTLEAWPRAFNIDEPIYSELYHEFYSTYEFDEVCVDDELKAKKIIKFRLCGRAFSWSLLEFARRLELYHSEEIKEEGCDVYLQGGLRIDEHFNAREYWLSISREENLNLSRSHASPIRNPILGVLHKMITYGLCQRITGQKESMIRCGKFITKIAKRKNLLSKDVLNSFSDPIYYRALDTTTLRELIDSEGRLIPEVLEPGVPRVAIPRPPRASMQDLYERIGSMEIRYEVIERMSYSQSYHWDSYAKVFEHMDRVYDVPLQGAYNPPGYDQQQYE